ncbi:hypothetical protein [Cryobacterium sp. TMS1-13-1]|uniref:hypothetical protein n=1 Tax=Cryobacterium sp. TMS1-13-1 TaxID=1259220 RepID=UPI00106CEB6E|nr:hypothetical protein [Cryobacterium sp. TMS1-13-1]TFD19239.1 hypothetical protein E3T31_16835 [Cryobacterium sp. TMS1-13-1]
MIVDVDCHGLGSRNICVDVQNNVLAIELSEEHGRILGKSPGRLSPQVDRIAVDSEDYVRRN